MNYFFSVIITTFNRPNKILRAIDSVLDQSLQDFEIVIVNDGSSEDYSIVEKYVSKNPNQIKYYYKKNEERSVARNFGIQKSTGQFICFLDDDDYYLDNHLQVLYNEISKQNFATAIYHTYSYHINSKNETSKMAIVEPVEAYNIFEYYVTDGIMTMNNTCGHITIFKEFPFNPQMAYAEDSYQRLLAMTKFEVFRIKDYTTVYDLSNETSTNVPNIKVTMAYINSWKEIFSNPLLKNNIRNSIKKGVLFEKYCLLLHYHRKELDLRSYCRYLYEALFYIKNWGNLKLLADNLRWRIQSR